MTNNLYDPSYAARGVPMDPHLRMILINPDSGKLFFILFFFYFRNNFFKYISIL